MGKRSDFERKPRDFYPTPIEAVYPLLPHLPEGFTFAEPCAGNGALIDHLETKGTCMWASDIEPQAKGIHTSPYDKIGFDELDPERNQLRISSEDTHPNREGHKIIVQEIYNAYEKIYI